MLGEPLHRAAYLGNDAAKPRRRRQRVFDDGEIDLLAAAGLWRKMRGLFVVHLPIAAMKKRDSLPPSDRQPAMVELLARTAAVRKRCRDESRAVFRIASLCAAQSAIIAPRSGTWAALSGDASLPGPCCGKKHGFNFHRELEIWQQQVKLASGP